MQELVSKQYQAAERFARWLGDRVVARARGDDDTTINGKPSDRFWLGRLATTRIAAGASADPRMERLEPCEIGFRLRLENEAIQVCRAQIELYLWNQPVRGGPWQKVGPIDVDVPVTLDPAIPHAKFGHAEFSRVLRAASGRADFGGQIEVEVERGGANPQVVVTLVNTSAFDANQNWDPRFYQASFRLSGAQTIAFKLDALEDTFRFDREVAAFGINCGVKIGEAAFGTTDVPMQDRARPNYWGAGGDPPNLSFDALASNPSETAGALARSLRRWGEVHWSAERLVERALAEAWSDAMVRKADEAAQEFWAEVRRIEDGLRLLEDNVELRAAFVRMNEAMAVVGARKGYASWRPFQLGFLLANLASIIERPGEADIVDIVWFATGGGKTETYLGLLVTGAFYDRTRGKLAGTSAWTRFPLRMLSLQQTQRFADAFAAAELVRRRHGIGGEPFSVGFLVGEGATPNRVRRPEQDRNSRFDPDDPNMPARFRLLQSCPFCGGRALSMKFSTATWTLEHRCVGADCPWPERALPFYVVDEEVFRFLPTVIVGTLDKAASIGMQQAMRGLVGAPKGHCPSEGHGYTYNLSSGRPSGCLVPDCAALPEPLSQDKRLYPPTFRLQDELHLLRDSLGAVDAHYEAVLDGLQLELTSRSPKILASSATLSGYQKQADVLYRRHARVFPQPPPSPGVGFWAAPTDDLMRSYLAIAPRGATIEFAVDRLITELQRGVRELISDPAGTCRSLSVDPDLAPFLLSQYGVNVVYGNTLRDLDAVSRSSGTQLVDVSGPVNFSELTGGTQFEQVSATLEALQEGDEGRPFDERVHVITASSMMSHGVDVDRLNTMIVLGLPLTTAEFIQATARVGRRWPSLVFVVHKMGRERDAGIFRSFSKFVEQGDRFVEPIPITGRSRKVLEKTIPGLEMARLLHVHAADLPGRLTTVTALRHSLRVGEVVSLDEAEALAAYLEVDPASGSDRISDIHEAIDRYFTRVRSPAVGGNEWFGNVWVEKPMRSLRDVDEQVPVHLRRDR